MNDLIFPTGSVPVRVAAKVYGRDPSWVRAGIISGWLPIGTATRDGKKITDLKEMNSIMTAFNESSNDKYAGWNEGEEFLMLNDVRCGIR